MSKIMIFTLFLLSLSAHAGTREECIEMMKVRYLWARDGKCDRAERQLEVAAKVCRPYKNKGVSDPFLKIMIQNDKTLAKLYSSARDAGKCSI